MAGPTELIRQNCPIATPQNDGLMSAQQADQLADLVVSLAEDDIELWVDSVNGTDGPDSGSEANPLKTVQAAFDRCRIWTKSAVIHCAEGTYEFSTGPYYLGTGIGRQSTPLQILGTPVDVGLGTMVMDGATTDVAVSAPTAATVTDAYRGAYLRNLTTGTRTMVTGNTFALGVTTFTVLKTDGEVTQTPGDEFIVEVPGTIFEATGINFGQVSLNSIGQFGVGMRDVKILGGSNFSFATLMGAVGWNFMEAVHFDGGPFQRVIANAHSARIDAASPVFPWRNAPVNPFSNDRGYAGLYIKDTALLVNERASFVGAMVVDNSVVDVSTNSSAFISSIDARDSLVIFEGKSVGGVDRGNISTAPDFGLLGAVSVLDGSEATLGGSGDGLDISDGDVSAVAATNQSFVVTGELTGTGNTGYGLVTDIGIVRIEGATTVTGTINDTLVGATAKAYAGLPFTEPDTFNRIQ